MISRELKNKPLVEAIFEIRWKLQQRVPGIAFDPHYRLLLGRMYDRLQGQYPEHEQLDTANIPDEMSGHLVQHRFRISQNDWPLLQLGPGICTVNDTAKYKWEDFRARAVEAKRTIFDAYPKPADLRVENLTLRYIDAVDLDYEKSSVYGFLKDKLKVTVSPPANLFTDTAVEPLPRLFQLQQRHRSNRPPGIIQLGFATGQRADTRALIWETTVQSSGSELPEMTTGFEGWLDQAHTLANDWFFKMIEGDLYRSFSGE